MQKSIHKTLIALALAAGAVAPAAAEKATFMTGPQGGSWIPIGGALKGMWEKGIPGLEIQQTPGAGVANVLGVAGGKAKIGMANSSSTVDGLAGRPPYKKAATNVCQIANLYPQYFQVVAAADSGINSYADLKGKTLVTQPKGNTAEAITGIVLKMNGMEYKDLAKANFQAGYNDAVAMMKDGHVQVFTLGTTAPASAIMDLASARDVKLVPVDDKTMAAFKKMNPGYNRLVIKAGTYPKQDKDVPVIGYSTHVIVACDMPEDTVYKMTKIMAANIDTLSSIVKAMKGVTPKDMAMDIGVPLHKGAAKFYKEAGAI